MRTSVNIPDRLLEQAKKVARERGTTLRQLVVDGLIRTLESDKPTLKHRMRDRSYGKGGLVSPLSWSDTESIDELLHGDRG